MEVKVEKLDIKNKRVIAISDIHGNLELLKKLLKKVNYSKEDILVIVGDFIEKGLESLKTLQWLMEENVCVVLGNCDYEIIQLVRLNVYDDSYFMKFFTERKSILKEMCKKISFSVSENNDISIIKKVINENFKKELDWLENLPTIVETEKFIFVHAGITSNDLQKQKIFDVTETPFFLKTDNVFEKNVVVGHYPTSIYSNDVLCYNPIIDEKKKIISIDGGNVIKRYGQLNAMIINKDETIAFESCDNLPEAKILEKQKASSESIAITWPDNEVEVLKNEDEYLLCKHVLSGNSILIPNEYIYENENKYYTSDISDYYLEVNKEDIVKVLDIKSDRYLAKKDGVMGWIKGKPVML